VDLDRISLGLDESEAHNMSRYTILGDTGAVSALAVYLDSYADRCSFTRLDFVKIDIEGAAIAGAQKVLRKFAPLVLLEMAPARLLQVGVQAQDLLATMCELGYRSWCLNASAETSSEFDNPDEIDIANVLFYQGDLPTPLRTQWNYRKALRWAWTGSRI
jgi:hypothetical protein